MSTAVCPEPEEEDVPEGEVSAVTGDDIDPLREYAEHEDVGEQPDPVTPQK